MRTFLLICSLLLLGSTATGWFLSRTTFSAYSSDQLDVIEAEVLAMGESRPPSMQAQRQLVERERTRRKAAPLAAAGGLVVLLGAALVPGSRRRPRHDSAEAARLVAHLASPEQLDRDKRRKAGALLGIAVDSAPAVIEAAYQAKLAEKDLSRLDGLAPDLQQKLVGECEELRRAKELLLGRGA